MLWWQYFALSWGWYFYITWLPTYLREARGVELQVSAVLAGLPLFLGGCGSMVCGAILPFVTRVTGDAGRARRLMACIGFVGAGTLLLISSRMGSPVWAMIAMGFSSFCNDLVMPPAWGACMDVGGKYAGTLSGSMNMFGNFAGGLAPLAIGYILDFTNQNWNLTLFISAAVYYTGIISWLFLDPVTPLEEQTKG
jgi:cyanate permease